MATTTTPNGSTGRLIPLWVKVAYTLFVAVLVPYYWVTYTPWNFLYFCDVALLATCVALWMESPLIVSMSAVGILLPQAIWIVDLLAQATAGMPVTGMTNYMFDNGIPLFVRGLSSFHGWLPLLLVWLVVRLGYDRRAFRLQALSGVAILLVCYLLGPVPPASPDTPNHAVNINYVYGMDDRQPQTALPPNVWVMALVATMVVGVYWPTHGILSRLAPRAGLARAGGPPVESAACNTASARSGRTGPPTRRTAATARSS